MTRETGNFSRSDSLMSFETVVFEIPVARHVRSTTFCFPIDIFPFFSLSKYVRTFKMTLAMLLSTFGIKIDLCFDELIDETGRKKVDNAESEVVINHLFTFYIINFPPKSSTLFKQVF